MKKFFIVFKFEFLNLVKSKFFIVFTLLVVVGIGVALSYPRIAESFRDADAPVKIDEDMTIGVINDSIYEDEAIMSLISISMPEYSSQLIDNTLEGAKALIKDEEYGYVLYLEGENGYKFVTESIGLESSITYRVDGILLKNYKEYLLTQAGLGKNDTATILNAGMQGEIIETGKNQTNSFAYTYMLVFFLYMTIIVYGQMVATSVASEKSSRAMEVLVTTIDPVRMMFGKVIGIGSAAILQISAVVGGGVFFYNLNKDFIGGVEILETLFAIPTDTIIISIILMILGFFVYAFMYAAVGSLVSKVEDISTGVLPITFVSIGSFFLVMTSMLSDNLDSVAMKIATYFPLTSPYALLVRTSMTDVGLWQSVSAIGILLATCMAIGYLAAMIYKLGVLMYGKPPKLKEVYKLLKNK